MASPPRSSRSRSSASMSFAPPSGPKFIMAYNNRREHGNTVVGEVTLDQVYGGARGIKSLVWEVSRNLSYRHKLFFFLSRLTLLCRALSSTLRRVSASAARP
jgi:hypothetical protein